MELSVRQTQSGITMVWDMVRAFWDENHCRCLLEAMVWPTGRICLACGYHRSIALMGRESGKWARHGLWLMLQSHKGISSIRLAQALGVSQPTAWRMGQALRLMVGREQAFNGVVEIDGLYLGGKPRRDLNYSPPGRGRKGQPKTLKTPALVAVQRPPEVSVGAPAGETRAAMIRDLSESEANRVPPEAIEITAHLMSDEWRVFVSIGAGFAAHDTVHHKAREYARGPVHINSAEGFNDRIRRTVSGVFHQISPHLADLYFNGNRLSLGIACCHRPSNPLHPQRTSSHQDSLGTCPTSAPTPCRVPLGCGARDAPNEGRRDRPLLEGSCVWLMMPAL
jgi:hypothetical protein